MDFEGLIGKTFSKVTVNEDEDEIRFYVSDSHYYLMHHEQSCCEEVSIEEIHGDLEDLVGSPILHAEESSEDNPKVEERRYSYGEDAEGEWTFYKLATVKGWVDIRWYGSHNGFYSIEVELTEFVNGSEVREEPVVSYSIILGDGQRLPLTNDGDDEQ